MGACALGGIVMQKRILLLSKGGDIWYKLVMQKCRKDTSVDQNLLYRACIACITCITSVCLRDLAKRTLGKIHHTRWITFATRILFLYMSTPDPSNDLTWLAWFIVNIYAHLWFLSRKNWRVTEGAVVAFKALKMIRGLQHLEKLMLEPVFNRGFG